MQISYQIKEEDYLVHQLYKASKDKKLRRKRISTWILITLLYAALGYTCYFHLRQYDLGMGFGILAVFWLATYIFYAKWSYKRKLAKHIRQHLKSQMDQKVILQRTPSNLSIEDQKNNKSNIPYSSIKEMIELPSHFLITTQKGSALMIPKIQFSDRRKLLIFLGYLVKDHQVNFKKELDWKW